MTIGKVLPDGRTKLCHVMACRMGTRHLLGYMQPEYDMHVKLGL